MKDKVIQGFYIPELDGLRFIAFLLVFIHNAGPILTHSPLEKISKYGWIGVDLFFCLSAFLITKLLLAEYEKTRSINVRNFYIRRALKIWPQYFLYVLIVFLFKDKIPSGNTKIAENLAGLITFTYNFVYFHLSPSPVLLFIHLWSVSYEFQYYFAAPWFVKRLISISNKSKGCIISSLLLAGNLIRAGFIYLKIGHPAIYFLPFTHFDSLLCGVALGLGLFDELVKNTAGWVLLFFGFIFNGLILLMPNNDITTWSLALTYPCVAIGMSLIILSVFNKEISFFSGLLKNKVMVFFGRISYGLYLFHIGSFYLVSQVLINIVGFNKTQIVANYPLTLVFAFMLTSVFAIISHYLVERPFLKLKINFGTSGETLFKQNEP